MENGDWLLNLPQTAWDDGLFVILFIFLVIGLLYWFSKQSDKWQDFLALQDDKWRDFSREQRKENNAVVSEMRFSVDSLDQSIKLLTVRLDGIQAFYPTAQKKPRAISQRERAEAEGSNQSIVT